MKVEAFKTIGYWLWEVQEAIFLETEFPYTITFKTDGFVEITLEDLKEMTQELEKKIKTDMKEETNATT